MIKGRTQMKTEVKIESTYDHGNVEVLDSLLEINRIDPKAEEVVFDLSRYNECNPFNNLLIAQTLKNFKKNHPTTNRKVIPCRNNNTNSYLQHLGFYKFFGAEYGKDIGVAQPNSHYVPITPIAFDWDFYDNIGKNADKLANLFHFDKDLHNFMKYVFIETIRNVFEHADTKDNAYISAQTWERSHLVEIAIIDSGCGISNALKKTIRDSSEPELLRMATSPGISAKSNHSYLEKEDKWRNSGYGLYILKRLALEYGGSLMVCSNNYCDYYHKNGTISHYSTFYPGTALAIRFKTDQAISFEETRSKIVKEGERESNSISGAIKSASKSSGGHYA